MALSKKPANNFYENIIKLSKSNNIEDAKKEWEFCFYNENEAHDGACICDKSHLKNVFIYRNKFTNQFLTTGKNCAQKHLKKFKLPSEKVKKLMKNLRSSVGWSQPYIRLHLNEFIIKVAEEFMNICRNNENNETKLKELLNELSLLMESTDWSSQKEILAVREQINNSLLKIDQKRKIQEEYEQEQKKRRQNTEKIQRRLEAAKKETREREERQKKKELKRLLEAEEKETREREGRQKKKELKRVFEEEKKRVEAIRERTRIIEPMLSSVSETLWREKHNKRINEREREREARWKHKQINKLKQKQFLT